MRPKILLPVFILITGLCTVPLVLPAQTNPPANVQTPPDKAGLDELIRLYTKGIEAHTKGDYLLALKIWRTGLEKARGVPSEKAVAAFLDAIGTAYESLGQNDKALEFHQKALVSKEKLGSEQDIAMSLNNIGNAYNDLHQNEKALTYFQKALINFEKMGNPQEIADSLNNIGVVYNDLGQQKKAEEFFTRGVGVFEKFSRDVLADPSQLGDLLTTINLYEHYALLLTQEKRPDEALLLLERSRAQALALQIGVNQNSLARFFTPEENAQLKTLKMAAILAARTVEKMKALPFPKEKGERDAFALRLTEAVPKKQEAVNRYELFRDTLYNKYPQFRLVQISSTHFHRIRSRTSEVLQNGLPGAARFSREETAVFSSAETEEKQDAAIAKSPETETVLG